MREAYEAWEVAKRPVGQPRKYADTEARSRAYREKRKKPAPETRPRYEIQDEIPARPLRYDLRVRLIDASNGNIDPLSDISPIRSLIEQGCDLELDVLPIVAREIPDLPRPLKCRLQRPNRNGGHFLSSTSSL